MKNCLLFLGVSALIGFGGMAHAQLPNKTQTKILFTQKAGVNEFSGKMIARPRQESDLLKAGLTEVDAERLRARAFELMGLQVIRHYPEVDEYILQVPFGSNENEYAQRLMTSGAFQYVEPDWILYPVVNPNDPLYPQQWHHPKINAPAAWNHFTGDGSVIIAITDTGVRTTHEDLVGRLVSGANSASGTAVPQTSGGAVEDINGHGTHCAGIAAAIGNNGIGVSGIGWNTKIMPIRVANSTGGSASLTALTAGARWAADNGARVISTSYSGFYSSSVQTTGAYIKNTRNGVYCWAAGNDNVNRTTGDHVDVTVVGNSTSSDGKNSSSAYGIAIDLFAPGTSIVSTYNSNNSSYVSATGTSMASPLAAGLAALITGTNPSLTAQQVETILYTTCFDLTASPGGVGNDNYWGWGRIDALAALRKSYNEHPFRATTVSVGTGSVASGSATNLGPRDNSYAS
ncbi:MAG TPA: S8 family serine peptidase, partial [Fimbriimonadaceae bacterium]|nr:S8 family serine peptidase [Fimbriimonadaceae bacterium]